MAEVERRRVDVPALAQPGGELENLPALIGKLGDDVMRLVDTKLSLVKVELKEDASFYARIGFALVNVAIAFFISNLFANEAAAVERFSPTSYGLGFLITGILYVVIGGVIVLVMKNKLAAYNPVPTTTLEEIRKDKQWLKNEI